MNKAIYPRYRAASGLTLVTPTEAARLRRWRSHELFFVDPKGTYLDIVATRVSACSILQSGKHPYAGNYPREPSPPEPVANCLKAQSPRQAAHPKIHLLDHYEPRFHRVLRRLKAIQLIHQIETPDPLTEELTQLPEITETKKFPNEPKSEQPAVESERYPTTSIADFQRNSYPL